VTSLNWGDCRGARAAGTSRNKPAQVPQGGKELSESAIPRTQQAAALIEMRRVGAIEGRVGPLPWRIMPSPSRFCGYRPQRW